MTTCPNCHKHYKEPEDEQYDYDCPFCKMSHEQWEKLTNLRNTTSKLAEE